jgi:hypothetical protein
MLLASMTPSLADFTTNDAITTLQIFSDGGEDLVAEVSMDVISDVSAIGSYCLAAGPASVDQKVAIVHGIVVATEGAPGNLSEDLARLSQQCCPLFTSVTIDERIMYGSRLALEARQAYGDDRRVSGGMQALVSSCSDDVLDKSFALALGNDRIGLYIAQAKQPEQGQYLTASGPEDFTLAVDE